jgi:hypothetical protein
MTHVALLGRVYRWKRMYLFLLILIKNAKNIKSKKIKAVFWQQVLSRFLMKKRPVKNDSETSSSE